MRMRIYEFKNIDVFVFAYNHAAFKCQLECQNEHFNSHLRIFRNQWELSTHLNFVFFQYGGSVKNKTSSSVRLHIFNNIKMFKVVILQQKRKLIVPMNWCRIIEKNFALIFNSRNKNAVPIFENIHRTFHMNEDRAYYGYILNEFGE